MTRRPDADDCTRVYTRTGKLAHLLDPGISPNLGFPALCGTAQTWYGTGSQAEHEHAASLPSCPRCEAAASAQDERARRLKEMDRQRREAS